MDYGNGGCCIARWTDEGHVSKMDMIMLKYRPIAPKPVSENGSVGATSDSNNNNNNNNNSLRDGRHAKQATVKGRRKSGTTTKKCNTTTTNARKRKSKSSDSQMAESSLDLDHRDLKDYDDQDLKGEVTLLPLFPEAPDLSPTKQANNNPIWLNFNGNNNNDNIMPMYEDNYGNCHGKSW